MAITKAAKKSIKQSERRKVFNLRRKRTMKTNLKEIKKLLTENKKEEALKLAPVTYKAIDKAAKRGVIKKNAASRKKSRLMKAIQKVEVKS